MNEIDSNAIPPGPAQNSSPNAFEFKGSGGEYFQVWIANILLTILTLGIYSAWAKVRTAKYFYNNTFIKDAAFDYTANPIVILKGRIIAVVLFALVSVSAQIHPALFILFAVLFTLLIPWIIVRSMMFNAYNSTYRNVRFRFQENYRGAYAAYFGWYLVTLLTLGLAAPVFMQRQHQFLVNNLGYGQNRFSFHAGAVRYYAIFGRLFLYSVSFFVAIGAIGVAFGGAIDLLAAKMELNDDASFQIRPIVFGTLGGVGYFLALVYIQVAIANLIWNNVRNGNQHFTSALGVLPMAWIQFSNIFMMVITAGLYYPWAKVRMTKYRLNRLTLFATPELNNVIAAEQRSQSALGEGVGDVFEVEFGL